MDDRVLDNIFEQISHNGNFEIINDLSYEDRTSLFKFSFSKISELCNKYNIDSSEVIRKWFSEEEVIAFIDNNFINLNDSIQEILIKTFLDNGDLLHRMISIKAKALIWIPKENQTQSFGYTAIKSDPSLYKYLRDDLKLDVEIAKLLIKSNRLQISFLPSELYDNREIIEFYIKTWGAGLHTASPRLCDDKDLVLMALKNYPQDIYYVSNRLRGDIDVMRLVIASDYHLIKYATGDVLNNHEILSLAFKKMLISHSQLSSIQIINLTKLFNRFYDKLFITEPLDVLHSFLEPNILTLTSLKEEDFDRFLVLFDYDKTLKLNDQVIDNVLESIIQREFKYQYSSVFNWFIDLTNLIDSKKNVNVIERLVAIRRIVGIDDLLKKHNITFEVFVFNLLNDYRDHSKEILHDIYLQYLDYFRNDYLKRRQGNIRSELNLTKRYDKKALLIKLWEREENEIIKLIYSINPSDLDDNLRSFLANQDLVIKCIRQRKNKEVNYEVGRDLYLLNRLLDKLYFDGKLDYLTNGSSVEFEYESNDVSNKFLFNIIKNIDIKHFFNEVMNSNQSGIDLYSELKRILTNFRLLGWGDTFNSLFKKNGMDIDSSTFVALFNYFYRIYPKLFHDYEAGRIKTINLSRILDEFLLYSSVPSKVKDLINEDDYNLICLNPELNAASATKERRLSRVPGLVTAMYKRKYITVPGMDEIITIGDKNCRVTIGNVTDSINLTLGERTRSCARILGLGENLFEFCLLNENGFHIVFRDPYNDDLISKASCFRNGNSVFINMVEISLSSSYTWSDLQKITQIIAQRIIEQTKNSEYPIENVFVSDKQAFDTYPVYKIIKLNDIDILYLLPKIKLDITPSNIICLNEDGLKDINLSPNNVVRYNVQRGKVKVYKNPTMIGRQIKKLHMINALLCGNDFVDISSNFTYDPLITTIYCGDDWYIGVNDENEVITQFVITYHNEEVATNEMNTVLSEITKKRSKS